MKTALVSVLTATLLGLASIASGRHFDAAEFIAIAFASCLAAWTVNQYSRVVRPLDVNRPIRLPLPLRSRALKPAARRLAA